MFSITLKVVFLGKRSGSGSILYIMTSMIFDQRQIVFNKNYFCNSAEAKGWSNPSVAAEAAKSLLTCVSLATMKSFPLTSQILFLAASEAELEAPRGTNGNVWKEGEIYFFGQRVIC